MHVSRVCLVRQLVLCQLFCTLLSPVKAQTLFQSNPKSYSFDRNGHGRVPETTSLAQHLNIDQKIVEMCVGTQIDL